MVEGGRETAAGARRAPSSVVLAGALCLIWALTFIAQRTALRESDPLWIAAGTAHAEEPEREPTGRFVQREREPVATAER